MTPYNLKRVVLAASLVVMSADVAVAQISNKPFTFRNGSPSIGMSVGGKQAIINKKLYGSKPHNLLRGNGGALLDVQEGPGESAIVSYQGTSEAIPGYRGTTFKGGRADISAGVFNAYFVSGSSGSSPGFASIAQMHGGATVNTWTARVITGGAPVSYLGSSNPVEVWTGQVMSMEAPVTH